MSHRYAGKTIIWVYREAKKVVHPTLLWKMSYTTTNSNLSTTFFEKKNRGQIIRKPTMDNGRTQVIPYQVIWYGHMENVHLYGIDNHRPLKSKIMHSGHLLHDKNDGTTHFTLF